MSYLYPPRHRRTTALDHLIVAVNVGILAVSGVVIIAAWWL